MIPQTQASRTTPSSWVMLPLRLFLGITFTYAGIQKFTDPQFFQSGTPGYIGRQLLAYATNTPLHTFLLQIAAPHALFFGLLVAYGEIAIGLGTLFGVFLRPATFFGMLISLTFFLSATWHTYPFFYGSDIVFVFCWLTLMLNGPTHTGLPSFDELLAVTLVEYTPPQRKPAKARQLSFLLGIPSSLSLPATTTAPPAKQRKQLQRPSVARRNFLFGLLGGGTAMFALLGLFYTISRRFEPEPHPATTGSTTPQSPATTASANTTPAATTTGGTGTTTIARVSAVPRNSAVTFTIPSSNNPGVLIHTQNDTFVAFDATCTHAGCPVDYDPSIQLLACPCHGAQFDPTQNATPVQGPAATALTPVAIHVDSVTGAITL